MNLVKRGVILVVVLLFFTTFVEAGLNLTLFSDAFGTDQPLEGFLEMNLTDPVASDLPLVFVINDVQYGNRTIKNITSSLVGVKVLKADIQPAGSPVSSKDLIFSRPGSKVELALDLSQGGVLHQSDIQNIISFGMSVQGSRGVTSPSLNIGNDKTVEWTYVGSPKQNVYLPLENSYIGDKQPEAEIAITGNTEDLFCQNVTLQPASKFKVKTLAKALDQRASLEASISMNKVGSSQDVCTEEAPCCTFPTKPSALQEMSCDIPFTVNDRTNAFLCVFVKQIETLDPEPEYYHLALKTTKPSFGFKAGRKTPVNYLIWGEYQDYERQLAGTLALDISDKASDQINGYIKKTGCGDKCLFVPLNVSSLSAGTLSVSNLQLKAATTAGTLTFTSFLPVQTVPESVVYNMSKIKESLLSYDLRAPSVEAENIIIKAFLGDQESNEVSFNVVAGPGVSIRYNKKVLELGETLLVQASVVSANNKNITVSAWDFGDGQTALGVNATHTYTKAGMYTVKFTATDSQKISGNDMITVQVGAANVEQELNMTRTALDSLKASLVSDVNLKGVVNELQLSSVISSGDANLTLLAAAFSVLNETQRSEQADVFRVQLALLEAGLPKQIILEQPVSFDAKIVSQDEVPSSLPGGSADQAQAIFKAQESVEVPSKAILLKIVYMNGGVEQFILVEQTFTGIGEYYLVLPRSVSMRTQLTPLEQLGSGLFKSAAANVFYTLEGSEFKDVTLASQVKALVVPGKLPEVKVEEPKELQLGTCPNGTCEADEDEKSCSEDCTPQRPILLFIGLGAVLIFGLLWIFGYKGKYSFRYFFSKKPVMTARLFFKSDRDYQAVHVYVQDAFRKGFHDDQIVLSLKKKSWSEEQINAVLQEAHFNVRKDSFKR